VCRGAGKANMAKLGSKPFCSGRIAPQPLQPNRLQSVHSEHTLAPHHQRIACSAGAAAVLASMLQVFHGHDRQRNRTVHATCNLAFPCITARHTHSCSTAQLQGYCCCMIQLLCDNHCSQQDLSRFISCCSAGLPACPPSASAHLPALCHQLTAYQQPSNTFLPGCLPPCLPACLPPPPLPPVQPFLSHLPALCHQLNAHHRHDITITHTSISQGGVWS
jgi:hypothetical protein